MKKLFTVLFCLGVLSTGLFAQALLTENKQPSLWNYELASTPNRPAPSPAPRPRPSTPGRSHRHHGGYYVDSFADLFIELFVELFIDLAFESNWYVTYDNFPYATSDYYIQYISPLEELETPVVEKYDRFDIGFNSQYGIYTGVLSTTARFNGYIFKFFGPVVEVSNYFSIFRTLPYYGNIKLGMELAGFQTFVFSWKWNFDWVLYYGATNVGGLNYGFTINSYPVKPIVIEYRCNLTDFLGYFGYEDDYYYRNYIFESYFEFGLMINDTPWEAYAAWTYKIDGLLQAQDNSFGIGAKYFF